MQHKKTSTSLLLAFLCVLVGCSTAGIKYGGMAMDNDVNAFEYAFDIYKEVDTASSGVFRCGGLVFIVIVIDTAEVNHNTRLLEPTARLRVDARLRCEYPELPEHFTLKMRLVEKDLDDDELRYRYAVAIRENAIDELLVKP